MSFGRRVLVGIFVALAAAGGTWLAWRPTDESRIRGELHDLAVAVRITEGDMQINPIGRFTHVSNAFEPLFDPDVRVSVPELTTLGSGRHELEQLVTAAPHYVRTFDVDFDNVTVKIDDARTSALVGATANVKALDRDGHTRNDKRAVDFRFAKTDGAWIITTVSVWPPSDADPQ